MSAGLALLASLDAIYERAVTDPDSCSDEALAEAAQEALGSLPEPPSRQVARAFGSGVRRARRLRSYWEGKQSFELSDWRMGVDEALGSHGWKPGFDLARIALEEDPGPELFEQARQRFRRVNFAPWLEGISYEDWVAGRPR